VRHPGIGVTATVTYAQLKRRFISHLMTDKSRELAERLVTSVQATSRNAIRSSQALPWFW
jgi:hypothetical protein